MYVHIKWQFNCLIRKIKSLFLKNLKYIYIFSMCVLQNRQSETISKFCNKLDIWYKNVFGSTIWINFAAMYEHNIAIKKEVTNMNIKVIPFRLRTSQTVLSASDWALSTEKCPNKAPFNCALDVNMTFPLRAIGVYRANPDVFPFLAPKLLKGDWDKYATDGKKQLVQKSCCDFMSQWSMHDLRRT